MDYINQMPNDLQQLLQSHLHPFDVLNLRLTCKKQCKSTDEKLFDTARYFKHQFDQKHLLHLRLMDVRSECEQVTIQLFVCDNRDYIRVNIGRIRSKNAVGGKANIFKFKLPEALRNMEGGLVDAVINLSTINWPVLHSFDIRVDVIGVELIIVDEHGVELTYPGVYAPDVNYKYKSYYDR